LVVAVAFGLNKESRLAWPESSPSRFSWLATGEYDEVLGYIIVRPVTELVQSDDS